MNHKGVCRAATGFPESAKYIQKTVAPFFLPTQHTVGIFIVIQDSQKLYLILLI